jgi:tetratricopeptide (TPR) repeat protein
LSFSALALLVACGEPPPAPAAAPSPCQVIEAAGVTGDPVAYAEAEIARARSTDDDGGYTRAEAATRCALERDATSVRARRTRADALLQLHRFGEAGEIARALAAETGDATAWLLAGDASMEIGDADRAADAYQRAVDLRPGLLAYDRIGWLRWMEGDIVGAREMAEMAVAAGSAADPEPLAFALARLGWLRALAREPAPQLDAALELVPGYAPALLARARVRLYDEWTTPGVFDRDGGIADLENLPRDFEAQRLLREFVPGPLDGTLDARGHADLLAKSDPAAALRLLQDERRARRDAVTHMTYAWALFHDGKSAGGMSAVSAATDARAALATGCPEPRVLHHGAIILGDIDLARRALAMGVGLLPSERAELRARFPELGR